MTEDADLGFRLARLGYKIETLASCTFEEAPARWRTWLGQRTRWLKGWMQTYLVHMRQPALLFAQLGPRRALAFQALLGGMILSALVHPWVYVAAIASYVDHGSIVPARPETAFAQAIWLLTLITLALGYIVGVALSLTVLWRSAASGRRSWRDVAAVLALPLYWLAISVAAYRAVIDLLRRPWHWEKTPHSPRPVTTPSAMT